MTACIGKKGGDLFQNCSLVSHRFFFLSPILFFLDSSFGHFEVDIWLSILDGASLQDNRRDDHFCSIFGGGLGENDFCVVLDGLIQAA